MYEGGFGVSGNVGWDSSGSIEPAVSAFRVSPCGAGDMAASCVVRGSIWPTITNLYGLSSPGKVLAAGNVNDTTNPAYGIFGDPTTGMYSVGAGQLGFAANGVRQGYWAADGLHFNNPANFAAMASPIQIVGSTGPQAFGGQLTCGAVSASNHALSCSYAGDGPFIVTRVIASGSVSMTTGAITAGNCGATVTVAATGVLTTDSIPWSFNAAPSGSNAGLVSWPTSGNVNFAYCPNSAETPAAATINWRVVR